MTFLRNSRSSILICSYIGTFVIAFVIGCAVVDDERIVVVMAYTTVIVNALLAAMAYLLYRDVFRNGFKKSGTNFAKQLFLTSVIILSANILMALLRGMWLSQVTENQEILNNYTAVFPIGMFFDSIIFAPIIEETIIREIIQNRIDKNLRGHSPWISILLCSCIFACMHAEISVDLLPYFAIGLILGVTYKKTNNLALVTCTHAVNNLAVLLFINSIFPD